MTNSYYAMDISVHWKASIEVFRVDSDGNTQVEPHLIVTRTLDSLTGRMNLQRQVFEQNSEDAVRKLVSHETAGLAWDLANYLRTVYEPHMATILESVALKAHHDLLLG